MNPRTKAFVVIVSVAAVLGLFVGSAPVFHLGPWASSTPAEDLGPVIARVNGSPIYLGLARARIAGLSAVHGDLQDTLGGDWTTRVLDSLVDDQLIEQEAARRGIVVTDDQIAAHVDQLKNSFGGDAAFDSWLKSQSMDLAELERRMRLQTIAADVYEAVTADVRVDATDIRSYYAKHRDDYRQSDGTVTPLFDVRTDIQQKLLKAAQDRAFAAWLQDRRDAASISIVNPDWWKGLT
jgi:SurA N-terminal domain